MFNTWQGEIISILWKQLHFTHSTEKRAHGIRESAGDIFNANGFLTSSSLRCNMSPAKVIHCWYLQHSQIQRAFKWTQTYTNVSYVIAGERTAATSF